LKLAHTAANRLKQLANFQQRNLGGKAIRAWGLPVQNRWLLDMSQKAHSPKAETALVLVCPYNEKHAVSIGRDLFKGLDPKVVSEGRKSLLAGGPDEAHSVCALHGDRVVGVCTGVRKIWLGERHRIEMVQVVVDEGFQRRGIAHDMMRKIASHFLRRGVEIVQVSAEDTNVQAVRAYEGMGFKRCGVLRNGLKFDERYHDEITLAIPLKELLGRIRGNQGKSV